MLKAVINEPIRFYAKSLYDIPVVDGLRYRFRASKHPSNQAIEEADCSNCQRITHDWYSINGLNFCDMCNDFRDENYAEFVFNISSDTNDGYFYLILDTLDPNREICTYEQKIIVNVSKCCNFDIKYSFDNPDDISNCAIEGSRGAIKLNLTSEIGDCYNRAFKIVVTNNSPELLSLLEADGSSVKTKEYNVTKANLTLTAVMEAVWLKSGKANLRIEVLDKKNKRLECSTFNKTIVIFPKKAEVNKSLGINIITKHIKSETDILITNDVTIDKTKKNEKVKTFLNMSFLKNHLDIGEIIIYGGSKMMIENPPYVSTEQIKNRINELNPIQNKYKVKSIKTSNISGDISNLEIETINIDDNLKNKLNDLENVYLPYVIDVKIKDDVNGEYIICSYTLNVNDIPSIAIKENCPTDIPSDKDKCISEDPKDCCPPENPDCYNEPCVNSECDEPPCDLTPNTCCCPDGTKHQLDKIGKCPCGVDPCPDLNDGEICTHTCMCKDGTIHYDIPIDQPCPCESECELSPNTCCCGNTVHPLNPDGTCPCDKEFFDSCMCEDGTVHTNIPKGKPCPCKKKCELTPNTCCCPDGTKHQLDETGHCPCDNNEGKTFDCMCRDGVIHTNVPQGTKCPCEDDCEAVLMCVDDCGKTQYIPYNKCTESTPECPSGKIVCCGELRCPDDCPPEIVYKDRFTMCGKKERVAVRCGVEPPITDDRTIICPDGTKLCEGENCDKPKKDCKICEYPCFDGEWLYNVGTSGTVQINEDKPCPCTQANENNQIMCLDTREIINCGENCAVSVGCTECGEFDLPKSSKVNWSDCFERVEKTNCNVIGENYTESRCVVKLATVEEYLQRALEIVVDSSVKYPKDETKYVGGRNKGYEDIGVVDKHGKTWLEPIKYSTNMTEGSNLNGVGNNGEFPGTYYNFDFQGINYGGSDPDKVFEKWWEYNGGLEVECLDLNGCKCYQKLFKQKLENEYKERFGLIDYIDLYNNNHKTTIAPYTNVGDRRLINWIKKISHNHLNKGDTYNFIRNKVVDYVREKTGFGKEKDTLLNIATDSENYLKMCNLFHDELPKSKVEVWSVKDLRDENKFVRFYNRSNNNGTTNTLEVLNSFLFIIDKDFLDYQLVNEQDTLPKLIIKKDDKTLLELEHTNVPLILTAKVEYDDTTNEYVIHIFIGEKVIKIRRKNNESSIIINFTSDKNNLKILSGGTNYIRYSFINNVCTYNDDKYSNVYGYPYEWIRNEKLDYMEFDYNREYYTKHEGIHFATLNKCGITDDLVGNFNPKALAIGDTSDLPFDLKEVVIHHTKNVNDDYPLIDNHGGVSNWSNHPAFIARVLTRIYNECGKTFEYGIYEYIFKLIVGGGVCDIDCTKPINLNVERFNGVTTRENGFILYVFKLEEKRNYLLRLYEMYMKYWLQKPGRNKPFSRDSENCICRFREDNKVYPIENYDYWRWNKYASCVEHGFDASCAYCVPAIYEKPCLDNVGHRKSENSHGFKKVDTLNACGKKCECEERDCSDKEICIKNIAMANSVNPEQVTVDIIAYNTKCEAFRLKECDYKCKNGCDCQNYPVSRADSNIIVEDIHAENPAGYGQCWKWQPPFVCKTNPDLNRKGKWIRVCDDFEPNPECPSINCEPCPPKPDLEAPVCPIDLTPETFVYIDIPTVPNVKEPPVLDCCGDCIHDYHTNIIYQNIHCNIIDELHKENLRMYVECCNMQQNKDTVEFNNSIINLYTQLVNENRKKVAKNNEIRKKFKAIKEYNEGNGADKKGVRERNNEIEIENNNRPTEINEENIHLYPDGCPPCKPYISFKEYPTGEEYQIAHILTKKEIEAKIAELMNIENIEFRVCEPNYKDCPECDTIIDCCKKGNVVKCDECGNKPSIPQCPIEDLENKSYSNINFEQIPNMANLRTEDCCAKYGTDDSNCEEAKKIKKRNREIIDEYIQNYNDSNSYNIRIYSELIKLDNENNINNNNNNRIREKYKRIKQINEGYTSTNGEFIEGILQENNKTEQYNNSRPKEINDTNKHLYPEGCPPCKTYREYEVYPDPSLEENIIKPILSEYDIYNRVKEILSISSVNYTIVPVPDLIPCPDDLEKCCDDGCLKKEKYINVLEQLLDYDREKFNMIANNINTTPTNANISYSLSYFMSSIIAMFYQQSPELINITNPRDMQEAIESDKENYVNRLKEIIINSFNFGNIARIKNTLIDMGLDVDNPDSESFNTFVRNILNLLSNDVYIISVDSNNKTNPEAFMSNFSECNYILHALNRISQVTINGVDSSLSCGCIILMLLVLIHQRG